MLLLPPHPVTADPDPDLHRQERLQDTGRNRQALPPGTEDRGLDRHHREDREGQVVLPIMADQVLPGTDRILQLQEGQGEEHPCLVLPERPDMSP